MSRLVVADPAGLRPYVKTEVSVTDYVEISQERIDAFADLSEDWQWIHTDVARARAESPFGTTVAHGFLTLSLLSRFLDEAVEVGTMRLLVSCGLSSVRFLSPVPSGGRVRARVRLNSLAEENDFVEAVWRLRLECEGVRLPCCIADWVVRYC